VLSAGTIAIVLFSIYNFTGFLPSIGSNVPNTGTRIQPVNLASSLSNKTTITNSASQHNASSTNSTMVLNVFENRDKAENYYSIQFPANAEVTHGNKSGSYIARLNNGLITSRFQDISDTTTVQLYILSQDEPSLKSSLQDYKQVSFKQLTIAGQRAWSVAYTWKNGTEQMESSRTYVEGPDESMVIEFTSSVDQFSQNNSLINAVTESFRWIG